MRLSPLFAAALVLAAASPGLAAELRCPASFRGAALKSFGNSTLFAGDPANNYSLVPATKMSGSRFASSWAEARDGGLTLVCEYVGGGKAAFPVPGDLRTCTQTGTRTTTDSIVCR